MTPEEVYEWNRAIDKEYEARQQAVIDEINRQNNPPPKRRPKTVKGITLK